MAGFEENAPLELDFDDQVFEIQFSPTHDMVASGLISGDIYLHRYAVPLSDGTTGNEQIHKMSFHKESVRAMQFSSDGKHIFTASADKSMRLLDMETGTSMREITSAHTDAINVLCMVEDNLLVSGDDGGVIKIWDVRQAGVALTYDECEDFISDITYHQPTNSVLTTSGDGTLSIFNVKNPRKPFFVQRSDYMDEELLSVCVMKNGKKVVCGTQEGIISIFSWGQWGDCSDRFPGHPLSIDTILPLTEGICLTGSSDGLIRAVAIHPHKLLGVVGQHPDFPVERLRVDRSGALVGSCSHDKTVQFWNVSDLVNDDGGEAEGDSDDSDADMDDDNESGKAGVFETNKDDFFGDL